MRTFNLISSLIVTTLGLLVIPIFHIGPIAYSDEISGELIRDTTWSGLCVIEGAVIVPSGIILKIEPGTVVLMKHAGSLVVYGQLLADGTENAPIRFTRYDDGVTWKQIMFVRAEDSRLVHCILEYADSEGAHQDYYELGPRRYHEAIVILASHVDIENCIFQKLPDDSSNAEGDAIAVISDDPDRHCLGFDGQCCNGLSILAGRGRSRWVTRRSVALRLSANRLRGNHRSRRGPLSLFLQFRKCR